MEELQKVAMLPEIFTQIDEFKHEMNELKKQITKEASMPIPQTTKATTRTATDSSYPDSEEQEDQQQKQHRQQKQLIKAAGRAAFLAITRKVKGR